MLARLVHLLRPGVPGRARDEVTAAAIAVLAALAIGSLLMLLGGRSPGHVWWTMLSETATNPYRLGDMLYKATGLALTGLAVAVALDAGLFNIGTEGQLTAGVLACAVAGTALPAGTPAAVAIPVCLLAAAIAGGAIGALIGVLRVARDAHEVITSIMLNAIVAGVALYLGNIALFRGGTTTGAPIQPSAELPSIGLGGSAASAALFIAVLAVAAVWWLRARTTWGLAVRAVGADPAAARNAGISVARVRVLAMTASGALAGLAAANFVLGTSTRSRRGSAAARACSASALRCSAAATRSAC